MLEYNFQSTDTSKVQKVVYLTNSEDNSYFLRIKEKDNLNYELYFLDYNGVISTTYVAKKDFSTAEVINLKCEFVSRFKNPYKYQVKNYNFDNRKDTLIDKENYPFYILKSNDSNREKKKKLGRSYYILEKSTSFHLPLLDFVTAYEEFKLERNIPNGIAKIMYFIGLNSQKKHIYILKSWAKNTRYLIVPKECNYSNP